MSQVDQYWYCHPCWERRGEFTYPPSFSDDRSRRTYTNSDTSRKRPRAIENKKEEKRVVEKVSTDKPTTLMLRNLPENLTRNMLMQIMEDADFGDLIDFIYVPCHFTDNTNFGYGFVNFEKYDDAERCRATLQGFSQWPVEWDKECDVSNGDTCQGVDAHVERYRNSPVMHESVPDDNKPAMYRAGVRLPFPAPTKAIKKPHVRARRKNLPGHTEATETPDETATP